MTQMNTVTNAWFEKSSECVLKTNKAHICGYMDMLTLVAKNKRDGMNFIPNLTLKKMLETNGLKATEVTQENGNEN